MSGPGEYIPDRTEGISRVEDLPKAKLVGRSRNYSRRPCPQCDRSCYRNRTVERTLHDLGDLVSERPRNIRLTYSQHYWQANSHGLPRDRATFRWHPKTGPQDCALLRL